MPYDLLAATLAPLATVLPVMLSAVLAFVLVLATAGDRDDTARWERLVDECQREEATARRLSAVMLDRLSCPPVRRPPMTEGHRVALTVLRARYPRQPVRVRCITYQRAA